MIVSSARKVIILLNMKTGSMTLKNVMTNQNRFQNTLVDGLQHNVRLSRLAYYYPEITDISDWRVVAFYREPVDRFLSGMAWHIQRESLPANTSVQDYVTQLGCVPRQINFLNPPNKTVELFNFHDFANEVVRMAASFGFSLNAAQIPVINESPNKKQISDLTTEELNMIRSIYAADYDFFAAKNITFG